jgi:predicted transcriptional regulator
MPRPASEQPTELELEILKVLWQQSPLPVREVRERLAVAADRELTHSSVITMLNIMVRKGFLRRQKEGKAFLFVPKVAKESVTGSFMGDLLSRVFEGSSTALVLNLLETADIDVEELAEIRRLINRKAKEQKS